MTGSMISRLFSNGGASGGMEVAEDALDDVFLLGGDGRDDLHRLLAGAAEGGVVEPDLGDEPGPRALALAEELGVLLGRGCGSRSGT
jgi:hypothetical protein